MKNKYLVLTISSILVILATLLLTNNFNSVSGYSFSEKINNYNSDLYEELTPSDLNMTKSSLLEKMKIPAEKREEFEFKFYKIEYKNINELHAVGKTDGEKCYNVAVTNASKLFSNFKQASLINFFQKPSPSEYHSCEGDPCESCTFERDENQEITGCDCSYLGGHCNHTIISG